MDIEFHYYITYIIACKAGFRQEDASIIAYASQYTDDNDTVFTINRAGPDEYSNYISQTMDIFNPQKEFMRIYPVFHFMPGTLIEILGNASRRRDGKLHLMNTTPDNANSRQLFRAALDSRDLYRIGIATHMYADTFAHQNFAGFNDTFNDMKGFFTTFVPGIGHADAKHKPDVPALMWEDKRLVPSRSHIDNRKRFLEAVRGIYEKYARYLNTHADSRSLIAQIDEAIGDDGDDEEDRIERYKALSGNDCIEYDKQLWFDEAVDCVDEIISYFVSADTVHRNEAEWSWKANHRDSHWYIFQEAVKAHQRLAMDTVIRPLFDKMEFQGL